MEEIPEQPVSKSALLYSSAVSDSVLDLSRKGLVLFYGVGNDTNPGFTEAVGTGVLVRLGEHVYCLTALHVFDEREVRGRRGLAFSCGRQGQKPLRVLEEQFRQATSDRRDDVAAFRLSPAQRTEIERIGQIVPFELDVLGVSEMANGKDGGMFVAGFPWRESETDEIRKRVDSKLLVYCTCKTDRECTEYQYFSPLRDLKVEYWRTGNIDSRNQPVVSPLPHGASGGPLWLYYTEGAGGLVIPKLKIVGISRRHEDKDNMVIGTDIRVMLETVALYWGELEGMFDKDLGSWRPGD